MTYLGGIAPAMGAKHQSSTVKARPDARDLVDHRHGYDDGTLSGAPSEAGDFIFTLTATDENGFSNDFSGQREYTLEVTAPQLAISPANLPDGVGGTAYESVRFTANGGDTPYSFALEGDLPEGLDFRNGTLSGTPTAIGDFTFTVNVTDAGDFTAGRDYTLTIAAPSLTLTPGSLPSGRVNSAYSASLKARGGTAPYEFTVSQGELPEGLTLAANGTLSGTPAASGSFAVTMTVTDRYGFTGSRDYVIAVEAAFCRDHGTIN